MNSQHPVNAVTNLQAAFAWFDVNVTRLLLQRFEQQLIYQPNHRRLLSHLGQFAVGTRSFSKIVVVLVGFLFDEFVNRVAADAELLFDELNDVVVSREYGLKPKIAERAEFVESFQIEGVACCDFDSTVLLPQRQQRVSIDR